MNTERLLAHFECIADAPDAIDRLRRFILDLAVRGRLVQQDRQEEPASELLKRVAAEPLRQEQPIRRHRSSIIGTSKATSSLPACWESTTLGMIAEVVMGQSPPGDTYNTSGEGIALINGPVEFSPEPFGKTTVNQYTTAPTKLCDEADLLVCVRGSTTGRTNIAGFRACIGRGVAAIKPHVGREFVRLLLLNARDTLIAMGRGIAFPSVSRKQIEDLAVLLPPLSEQARIVKRVDELMALCDQIEAARVKRETKRERLTIACGRGFSHRRLPPFDTDLDDFRKDLRPDQSVQASPFGPYELSIREQRDVRQENRTDTTRGR